MSRDRFEYGVRNDDSGNIYMAQSEELAEAEVRTHNQLDKSNWVQPFTKTVVFRRVSEWEPTP